MQNETRIQSTSKMFKKHFCMPIKSRITTTATGEPKECHLLNKKQSQKVTYLVLANTIPSKYLKNYLWHQGIHLTLAEGADH